ncbi:dolichol-phosphate mannosyltransferase subunit 3 isoform X2 [Anabrus simplex]
MTKLMEWLFGLGIFASIWGALVTRQWPVLEESRYVILFMPVILLVMFGVYAAFVVLWRVYTFNNCEDAAKELQEHIQQAKADLTKKGFKFDTKT